MCGRYAGQEDKGGMSDLEDVVTLPIHDARKLEPKPSLEDMGFEVHHSPSSCANLEDDDEIKNTYYPEVEQLLLKVTGASRVIVFDHTARWTEKLGGSLYNLGEKNVAAAPVTCVHADYTDISAPNRIRQLITTPSYTGQTLTQEDAEQILQKHYVFMNVWRNTRTSLV